MPVGCQNVEYTLLLSSMDVIKKLGKKIKIARISHDPEISTEKLAELVGVSRQTINNIEGGRTPGVSFLVILAIAKTLGTTLSDLVHDEAISAESIAESLAEYKTTPATGEGKKKEESNIKCESPEAQHERLQKKIRGLGEVKRKKKDAG